MGRVQDALRRADQRQQRHPWLAFPSAVVRKFGDDGAGGLAALIAYYGFFSLFPLMLVVVTVASYALHGNEELQRRIVDSALAQFPVIGIQIRDNVGSVSGSAFALVVGIGGALWAGMAVITSVQTAMDEVWDVPRRDRAALIPRVLRGTMVLIALGAALIAGALGAGASTALGSVAAALAGLLIAAAINVATMLIVFRVLTAAPVSWRDVLPGAVLAGVVWTGLQAAGGYIVDRKISVAGNVYGLFAVVIGLLSWLYLGAQLTLVAAEVNVVLRRHLWPRSFFPPPTRPQDERALTMQVQQEQALASEHVSVDFDRTIHPEGVDGTHSG
jgi:YihY family inner membrane protein